MAKKNTVRENTGKAPQTSPQKPIPQKRKFTLEHFIPVLVVTLYMLVHFIVNFEAYDAFGPQWMYVVILDLLVIILLLARRSSYLDAFNDIFSNIFSKLYLAFFALAGISIFAAINPTESWVCYVRIIATVVAFLNVSVFLYNRTDTFKIIVQVLGIVLLIESLWAISDFAGDIRQMELTQAILNMKGTAGNKNIFAAGLVTKIPFVIYCIYISGLWGKILNISILVLGSFTLYLVNARATYISLLLMTIVYILFCIQESRKQQERKTETLLYKIGTTIVPLVVAFLFSQIVINNVKSIQDGSSGYGTVTERFESIGAINSEINQIRLRLWAHAIDYTKHHPLMGCGIGNWKIASIPYQRTLTNDLIVPIHSHNDFVEIFAELGVPGGLLYLSLFICITVFSLRTYFSKADERLRLIAAFSFMAFIGYGIDAFFNFPIERPVSQLFFVLIAAITVNNYIKAKRQLKEEAVPESIRTSKASSLKAVFCFTSILLLLPSLYITYLTYKSLTIQRTVMEDLNNEPLKLNWKDVVPAFPSIPNLSAAAQPIEAVKGRYLYEAGKFDEALALFRKGREANPVIGYSEFLEAGLYYKLGKYDTAAKLAQYAFNLRPRAKTYYQTLVAILARKSDTIGIRHAFAQADSFRHEGFVWNLYIQGMLQAQNGRPTQELLAITDSAIHMFTPNKDTAGLLKRRQELTTLFAIQAANHNQAISVNNIAQAQKYYAQGVAAFGSGNAAKDHLKEAAEFFKKAGEFNPGDYTIWENTGMCYFNMQDFKTSIIYFNKALAMPTCVNGKSEFFKGVALMNTGDNKGGCEYLHKSQAKGYKEKEADMKAILKSRCGEG